MPDAKLAARLGLSVAAVRYRRVQLGRPPVGPVARAWNKSEESLLGTLDDEALATRIRRSKRSVAQHRRKLGIAVLGAN